MAHNDSPGGSITDPVPPGIAAVRAWWDLEQARSAYNADLMRDHGITGAQLALLRIIAEREPTSIRALRTELAWHPASLGQAAQRLADRGLLDSTVDPDDRRRRVLRLTDAARRLLAEIPTVGPVRLRTADVSGADARAMARGFTLALDAFGLTPWMRRG